MISPSDGWVSVDPLPKGPSEYLDSEDDPSIWVVFSKSVGKERFHIRFPTDPHYFYPSSEEIEVFTSDLFTQHHLSVLKGDVTRFEQWISQIETSPDITLLQSQQNGSNIHDFFCRKDEKWLWIRCLLTSEHCYIFQTQSGKLLDEPHRNFIQSFALQK